MRTPALLALATIALTVSGCATTTPGPAPSPPQPTASAAGCADSPGPQPLTLDAQVTARDLCEADGQSWQPAGLDGVLETFPAYASDEPSCEATYQAVQELRLVTDDRVRGFAVLDPDDLVESSLEPALVDVATIDHPTLARDALVALDATVAACDGQTVEDGSGGVDAVVVIDGTAGWSGMRLSRTAVDDPAGAPSLDVVQRWMRVDDRAAIVQLDASLDPEVAETVLDAVASLLASPREPEAIADDCSASTGVDPDAETLAVTPADLCAIDGRPWAHTGYDVGVEYAAVASSDAACAAAADASRRTFDIGQRFVLLAGADPFESVVHVAVSDDPDATAAIVSDLDAIATCAGTPTVVTATATQTMQRIDVADGWTSIAIAQTPGLEPGILDPRDVTMHWASVDGRMAFLEIPAGVDDAAVRTLLDAQLAALEA